MQYPQIQFYKGSLVRLASGKLKQVEDLNSEDFLESAKLISRQPESGNEGNTTTTPTATTYHLQNGQSNSSSSTIHHHQLHNHHHQQQQQQHRPLMQHQGRQPNKFSLLNHNAQTVDENNNSVFNSPEPTPSFDSPTMELMEMDEEDDEDEELDVVSHGNDQLHNGNLNYNNHHHLDTHNGNSRSSQFSQASQASSQQNNNNEMEMNHSRLTIDDDLYIDSSVVKDFLEVGPTNPPSTSPTSSTSSQHLDQFNNNNNHNNHYPSTSSSSSPSSSIGSPAHIQNPTVLIKFFLESSRSIVFIEVPIEHPFFVFHRGWSSWNPQRTYDKFGLKCRKLKIGDTCISLIRKQSKHLNPQQQQDSDQHQCNILFSSIKINE